MSSKQYVEGFGEVRVGISAKIVKEAKLEVSKKGESLKRASLVNPTRPETPLSEQRNLYNLSESYSTSRPNSALLGSLGKLEPIFATSRALPPVVPNKEGILNLKSIEKQFLKVVSKKQIRQVK